MKMFVDIPQVFLHKAPVDFRKGINGLGLLVEQQMALSPFTDALFVFCIGSVMDFVYGKRHWNKTSLLGHVK